MDDSKSLATLRGSFSDLIADFKSLNDEKGEEEEEKVRTVFCWEAENLAILERYVAIAVFVDGGD